MSDLLSRLNASLEGRYRVERELGEGGMATVYLAEDLRHRRSVALKVLKPELAAAVGPARFLSEIRTTANLQHPHILPLFDSGEADAFLFFTMPYVEGETLRGRLDRVGRLGLDEAVGIATDVAEALQVAHERGIIHRDIKPSNILLSRGKALVADFGIARATELSGDHRLTETGSSIGTLGYMSPEQASGDSEVDARSDIYSLGCVLFEMLAGASPYGGGSAIAVLARQATEPVPSVRASRPDVSAGLERAVTTALAKEPDERFDSVSAFAAALSAARTTGSDAAPEGKTILVLPLVNRSPDPDNEYFSDGLTEEIISDLAGVSAVSVISRNSAMALKGTTLDTKTLAQRHGVTHLVTGSVRKAGTSLRVTVELVEATTDRPLWSEKFSGTLDDIFQIQEEISRQIVSALKVRLTVTEEREVGERPIGHPVAYDCYLQARRLTYAWTAQAQHQALRLVDEAIHVAGESALLLATKAQIHWNMANSSVTPPEEAIPRAQALVDRAFELDPRDHMAIYVRGLIKGIQGQVEGALEDLYAAQQMRPGDVLLEWARWSQSAGLAHTERDAERFLRLDPLFAPSHMVLGLHHTMLGRREDAAPSLRRALEMSAAPPLRMMAGWALAETGHREEGTQVLEELEAGLADDPHRPLVGFLASALRGDEARALSYLTPEALRRFATTEWDYLILAGGHALLGRNRDAVSSLRRAVEYGQVNYPFMSEQSSFFEPLRGEPDFQALMAEVKPRWEALRAWQRGLEG